VALERQIEFLSLGSVPLGAQLALPLPLIAPHRAHRQLDSVEHYARDPELGATSVAVESHYIDRDFIEDYSVFYSKNLDHLPNYCRRVHFFNLEARRAEEELRRIRQIQNESEFRAASQRFAKEHYLGFSVIKPLPGCPVGRTVLRCFGTETKPGFRRDFSCACDYQIHLMGIPLQVSGLAFQQQDLGVSACATTALWSALQRARELESGTPATPAHITLRASQYALPFGRSMPSEGLSLDQMCQAVQSLGYAPNLFRAEKYAVSRWIIFAAVRSGISPVLILQQSKLAHAVAVAGMKLRWPHRPDDPKNINDELAADLAAVYVHDDRFGPYMRAEVEDLAGSLDLRLRSDSQSWDEAWRLSHILVPMHNKVRLSLGQLRSTAFWLAGNFQSRRSNLGMERVRTEITAWIERSHSYIESQLEEGGRLPDAALDRLCDNIPLSRYVGVVRLTAEDIGSIDVLLDTTSTERNLRCLALIRREAERPRTNEIAGFVAERLNCPYLG
jgi:hypothetical protein